MYDDAIIVAIARPGFKGLLKKFEPSFKSALKPSHQGKDGRWYADMQTPISYLYHANLVPKDKVPLDWDELLQSRYAKSFVVRFPLESGTMRALYSALIDRQIRKGRDLKAAIAWMRRLEKQVGRYANHSQVMFQTVGQGVFKYGFWNLPEIAMRSMQGYPVSFVFPKSGVPVLLDAVGLIERPDVHPLAKEFVEFVGSKKFVSESAAPPFNRVPARTDLPAGLVPSYLKDKRYKEMPVNWQRVAREGNKWLELWKKQVFMNSGQKNAH